jgi:hypothetical protein
LGSCFQAPSFNGNSSGDCSSPNTHHTARSRYTHRRGKLKAHEKEVSSFTLQVSSFWMPPF